MSHHPVPAPITGLLPAPSTPEEVTFVEVTIALEQIALDAAVEADAQHAAAGGAERVAATLAAAWPQLLELADAQRQIEQGLPAYTGRRIDDPLCDELLQTAQAAIAVGESAIALHALARLVSLLRTGNDGVLIAAKLPDPEPQTPRELP